METDIGIDLGTTFSVIAVDGKVELAADYPGGEGIYLTDCNVTVIPSPVGEQTFPSVVMEDPDHPALMLFGSDALQRAEEGYAPVLFSKRKIGTREAIPLQTRTVRAVDVAREFLRYLKKCAEQALGTEVVRAVITHPAYFDRGAVEETREAARDAGFDMSLPEQTLMEPVAAALAYTRTDNRDPLRLLTYDLGGGTFDVTYLERREGVINMRAFDGDHLLGGYNFDRELAHWIRLRLEERGRRIALNDSDPADRGRLVRLLRLAEKVKIDLSHARSDDTPVEIRARDILVDAAGLPIQINERITRAQFVELIRPQLDETVRCCLRALQKAGASPDEIDEILLVGGSAYGPWVSESLERAFPGRRARLFSPDLCVGAGAAIFARMSLPPLVRGERYSLLLDVPESSVLDVVNVAGQVRAGAGSSDGLAVVLRLPGGAARRVSAGGDGRFLFDGVELASDVNHFDVRVEEGEGVLLSHPFSIIYAPLSSQASAVATVLPRPLFVETVDGFAPLAEEGVALPARCQRSFQRVNDNPAIALRLFQGEDPIGEIRIERIPPAGGRGAVVDIEVEVTEKNQIRGTATVRTPSGQVAIRTEVSVHFDMPDIPSAEDLYHAFNQLRDMHYASGARHEAPAETEELITRVEHLFEQLIVERQEIFVALRRLGRLVVPPDDSMKPTLEEFNAAVARCRDALRNRIAQANETVAKHAGGEAGDMGIKSVENARQSVTRVSRLSAALDRLEKEGEAAHRAKDKRLWSRVHDAVLDVAGQVEERSPIGELPTFLHKIVAARHVFGAVEELAAREEDIGRRGQLGDWEKEVLRIRRALGSILEKIDAINDDLPSDQGLAQVRQIILRDLPPLQQAVRNLGIDVRAR